IKALKSRLSVLLKIVIKEILSSNGVNGSLNEAFTIGRNNGPAGKSDVKILTTAGFEPTNAALTRSIFFWK
ncbi:MAG: hypothetical protein J6P39_03710, partial [Oscillospiraceae bacterium]|nr:hypothetical protein [Oscillospiraceae bacterium]